MNSHLIQKIIEANGELCPELKHKNPLLDRNVAKSLSKSFVKILNISQQNSNINNNLRLSILENIRKLCNFEPEDHLTVDESVTESLTELYTNQIQSTCVESPDKDLDAFLVRKFKSLNVNSQFESSINPEIVQALMNLNDNGVYLEILSKDIVHWDVNRSNNLSLIKNLWTNEEIDKSLSSMNDDIAIKLKPEIERLLLNVCYSILSDSNCYIDHIFSTNASLTQLVKKCSISSECFQISCGVLNFLFIMTNFDTQIQEFIPKFVKQVKLNCPQITFSVLYPVHMKHVVVLLDFEIDELPEPLRRNYVTPSINYLQNIRKASEYDFILLLSHFPQWFDIYFDQASEIQVIN